MDFVEVEGKTYEEAIKKASQELNLTKKTWILKLKRSTQRGF